MPDGEVVTLGGKERTLRFDLEQVEIAERLIGGKELRVVLFTERSKTNVFKIAAAGFSSNTEKVSYVDVRDWVKDNPKAYPELEKAIFRAVATHLEEYGELSPSEAKAMGEALGAAGSGAGGGSGSNSPGKPG